MSEIVVEAAVLRRDFELKRTKRTLQAVRDVDLRIYENETVALVGESGSGKSTLARMLMGLLPPTAGHVRIMGRDIASLSRWELSRLVQPVFQDPFASLNPRRRIGDIVAMPLQTDRSVAVTERNRRVEDIMQQVGLAPALASRLPSELSGGQRQRVSIARALIAQPRILICDEPTSALDVSVQAQILNLLQSLRKARNVSLLIITHNIGVVETLADRIAVMYLGKIVEEGPVDTVLQAPRHHYTKLLLSAVLPPDPDHVMPDLPLDDVLPDPSSPPTGCGFNPRCPRAEDLCRTVGPALGWGRDGVVACHFPVDAARQVH
jgi:peptide/nickel transport system ATP-binding protein